MPISHIVRDLVIEHLASDEAALRARVRSLESDVDAYRALAQQLLHALSALREPRRLLEENRQLREELMRRDLQRAA